MKNTKTIILHVLSGLFGLMMINSGLNKLFQYMPLPEISEPAVKLMSAFIESKWIMPLLATIEIIAGVLFIIPRTRALGAIAIFPITVGIFLFHATLDPNAMGISITIVAINIAVILENYKKYLPMISKR